MPKVPDKHWSELDEYAFLKESNTNQIRQVIRKAKHPEFFFGFNDSDIREFERDVPTYAKAMFKNVFGNKDNLKLILHPGFKRLSLFTRDRKTQTWMPVVFFQTMPKEGYLPEDLQRGDRLFEHLRGRMGDYREITYQDLEFVERLSFWKYGWENVLKFLDEHDGNEARRKEAQAEFDDFTDGFLDHYFWGAMQEAQDGYSKPWSTRTIKTRTDPGRWKITQKNGYTIRERVYGEEGDANEMRAVAESMKKAYEEDHDQAAAEQGDEIMEQDSAAAKATRYILARKNKKFKEKHGQSLWEKVTGQTIIWAGANEEEEMEKQAEELVEMAMQAGAAPEHGETIEEWLVKSQKTKVPV